MVAWRVVHLVESKVDLWGEKRAEKKVFVTAVCWAEQKAARMAAKWVV